MINKFLFFFFLFLSCIFYIGIKNSNSEINYSAPASASSVTGTSGEFTGNGTSATPLKLAASSATMQGNTFNGNSQLVKLNASGIGPDGIFPSAGTVNLQNNSTSDGSISLNSGTGDVYARIIFQRNLADIFYLGGNSSADTSSFWLRDNANGRTIFSYNTGLDAFTIGATAKATGFNASSSYTITSNSLVAFSSVPVHQVCGYNSVATLPAGTTFNAFTPSSDIYIRRGNSNIVVASAVGTTMDSVQFGTAASSITASSAIGAAAGTYSTVTSTGILVLAGNKVSMWLQGDTTTKPIFNACLEYVVK